MQHDAVYDIHAVLEHYGWDLPGERTGWVTVKCHEHEDSHASARINADLGAVKCMACGFSGDAISIIRSKEGCSYAEAVRLAEAITTAGGKPLRQPDRRGSRLSGKQGYNNRSRKYVPAWRRGAANAS